MPPMLPKTIPARALLAAGALLAACSGVDTTLPPPTAAELADADYGPSPYDWEQKAREFLTSHYADQGVFQVKLREPRTAWYGARGGIGRMRDIRYGWAVGFRAFRLGFAALDSEVARGEVFFRDDAIDAIADQNGLVFVGR